MKNLNKLFNESIAELHTIGIEPGKIVSVTINTRAKKRYGQAQLRNGTYRINISERLMQDDISDINAKDTIIHEILHTCPNCMNHGAEWQRLADKVNTNYPQYHIQRCNSYAEKGLRCEDKDYRYNVICEKCNHSYNYNRAGRVVQHPESFHCTCGGRLYVKFNQNAGGVLTANALIK